MNLPTLFKKTSTGAIQSWRIWVNEDYDSPDAEQNYGGKGPVGVIFTEHGQVGGKLQITYDVVREGKNTGKANATSAFRQAEKEAEAKHTKQLKKGYTKTIEEAQAGEVDEIIAGGIAPMLAHKYRDHAKKITFPAFAQPKLDGHRCIAIVKDGVCTLWSRTRKPITGVPHINRALQNAFEGGAVVLDGEAFTRELTFEQITSFLRSETPLPGHEAIEYHVYDWVNNEPFRTRNQHLWAAFGSIHIPSCLKQVETVKVNDHDQLMELFTNWLAQGYEGAMVRNTSGLYENKRSYGLQKVKEYEDAEFEIIGVEEGRGSMAGKAIFKCKTNGDPRMAPDGTFDAKMKGKLAALKVYFDHPERAIGRQLTVRFQGVTNKERVPRFPVGWRFKEDV